MFQVVSGFRESSLAKKRGYFLYSLIGATCFFACFSKGSSGFIRYKQDSGNRYLQMHSLGVCLERVIYMDIREMRTQLGDTQSEFSARYGIPFRTEHNWEAGVLKPPEYVSALLEDRIREDLVNRRSCVLPKYDPKKPDLPKRSDFVGAVPWLKAVRDCLGENVVFALDEALMCQGSFTGHSDEYIIWIYGNDSAARYNGVVVLGNGISSYNVQEKDGLFYTNFMRTVSDALANESILDMQGITEALSKYYYANGESFSELFVAPEYQERFEQLANDAIYYYDE